MLDGMTNIKAREVLKELKDYTEDLPHYSPDEVAEAIEMAIKALDQQPNRCDSCKHYEEQDGSNCYECVKGMADNFEAQPTHGSTYGGVSWGGTYKEKAQPTDADCISRKSIRQKLQEEHDFFVNAYGGNFKDMPYEEKVRVDEITSCIAMVVNEPPVQPQRPKGKWIEGNVSHKEDKVHIDEWQSAKCSNCGLYHTTPYMYYFDIYKYCPNCGAEMEGNGE